MTQLAQAVQFVYDLWTNVRKEHPKL